MDCVNPQKIQVKYEGTVEVPCGSCILCRIARTREWSTRLQLENSQWNESVFVTLTYDDDHLRVTPCGHSTLWKPDLQNFFKRLRDFLYHCAIDDLVGPDAPDCAITKDVLIRARDLSRIKYFACGEYGSDQNTARAHYHAIIFGLSPRDIVTFRRIWTNGFVSVGGVSPQSIQYVTGYVRKKLIKKSKAPEDCVCLHRVPEFQLQSQGLGLDGFYSLKDKTSDRFYIYLNGHRESIPRYFLKKDRELHNRVAASRRGCDTRMENLKRAQEILNMRAKDVDILVEQQKSAIHKAKTEYAKNALFQKGSL